MTTAITTRSALTLSVLSVWAASLLLAGCASTTSLSDVPVETRAGAIPGGTTAGAAAGGATSTTAGVNAQAASNVARVDANNAQAAANAAGRVVYFDFDSFVLADQYKPVVDAHARALTSNRAKRLMVEGHTDERGGREYNLALGQKRADSVVRVLTLLGAKDEQIEAVSFGKESPAAQGNDEAAWAKNRRAELKDKAK